MLTLPMTGSVLSTATVVVPTSVAPLLSVTVEVQVTVSLGWAVLGLKVRVAPVPKTCCHWSRHSCRKRVIVNVTACPEQVRVVSRDTSAGTVNAAHDGRSIANAALGGIAVSGVSRVFDGRNALNDVVGRG